jgi:tetratricopeptide (TPR) repeat protein
MLRRAAACVLLLAASACDGGGARARVDPALKARIATARADARARPGALVRLGELQLEAGQLFDAAESFRRAREAGVKALEVEAGLARTYVKLGYVPAALRALRRCFDRDPGQPSCLFAYASLVETDPSEGAQREVQKIWTRYLQEAPPDHFGRAYAESALAQLEGRFGPLTPGALGPPPGRARPDEPEAEPPPVPGHEGGKEGEFGELNPFGRAIQEAYRALAQDDATGAIAAFERALEIQPDDPTTLAGLAEAQLEAGQANAAEATANEAYRLAPEEPPVRYAFGLVMLTLERESRAREALAAWRALARDTPEYAARLGVNRILKAGRVGDAPIPTSTSTD